MKRFKPSCGCWANPDKPDLRNRWMALPRLRDANPKKRDTPVPSTIILCHLWTSSFGGHRFFWTSVRRFQRPVGRMPPFSFRETGVYSRLPAGGSCPQILATPSSITVRMRREHVAANPSFPAASAAKRTPIECFQPGQFQNPYKSHKPSGFPY